MAYYPQLTSVKTLIPFFEKGKSIYLTPNSAPCMSPKEKSKKFKLKNNDPKSLLHISNFVANSKFLRKSEMLELVQKMDITIKKLDKKDKLWNVPFIRAFIKAFAPKALERHSQYRSALSALRQTVQTLADRKGPPPRLKGPNQKSENGNNKEPFPTSLKKDDPAFDQNLDSPVPPAPDAGDIPSAPGVPDAPPIGVEEEKKPLPLLEGELEELTDAALAGKSKEKQKEKIQSYLENLDKVMKPLKANKERLLKKQEVLKELQGTKGADEAALETLKKKIEAINNMGDTLKLRYENKKTNETYDLLLYSDAYIKKLPEVLTAQLKATYRDEPEEALKDRAERIMSKIPKALIKSEALITLKAEFRALKCDIFRRKWREGCLKFQIKRSKAYQNNKLTWDVLEPLLEKKIELRRKWQNKLNTLKLSTKEKVVKKVEAPKEEYFEGQLAILMAPQNVLINLKKTSAISKLSLVK